jgi:hypothetical protein
MKMLAKMARDLRCLRTERDTIRPVRRQFGIWHCYPGRPEKRVFSMSVLCFTCCSVCGRNLHTTFFCQECGEPSCSLDCYCRHSAKHSAKQETAQVEHQVECSSTRLESVG